MKNLGSEKTLERITQYYMSTKLNYPAGKPYPCPMGNCLFHADQPEWG